MVCLVGWRTVAATMVLGAAAPAATDTLVASVGLPVGPGGSAIAVGDVNGDGLDDVLVWALDDAFAGHLERLLGLPGGGLARPVPLAMPLSSQMAAMELEDIDGDGDLDLVSFPAGSLLGDGSGVFAAPLGLINWPFGWVAGVKRMELDDLNGDGVQDMLVVTSGWVALMMGNGDGTFAQATSLPPAVAQVTVDAVVGDLDEDGLADIVVAVFGQGTWWYRGLGTGAFAAAVMLTPAVTGQHISGMELADVNADGHLDLISARSDSSDWSHLVVARGVGDGSLGLPTVISAPTGSPTFLAIHQTMVDADGDGDLDAVLVGMPGGGSLTTVRVFEQVAAGVFVFSGDHLCEGSWIRPVVGEVTGDGRAELLTSGSNASVNLLAFSDEPFVSLGYAKPLTQGALSLTGVGGTAPGDVGALLLSAPVGSLVALLVGPGVQWLGAAPGQLLPSSAQVLPIAGGGGLTAVPYVWPAGFPPTVTALTVQAWATDGLSVGTSELLAVVAE